MNHRIRWEIFLRVATAAKADKILGKLRETTRGGFEVESRERYWKDEELFRAVVETEVFSSTKEGMITEVLTTGSRMARLWVVGGPLGDAEDWEFSGAAQPGTISIPGIDSILYSLASRPQPVVEMQTTSLENAGPA